MGNEGACEVLFLERAQFEGVVPVTAGKQVLAVFGHHKEVRIQNHVVRNRDCGAILLGLFVGAVHGLAIYRGELVKANGAVLVDDHKPLGGVENREETYALASCDESQRGQCAFRALEDRWLRCRIRRLPSSKRTNELNSKP